MQQAHTCLRQKRYAQNLQGTATLALVNCGKFQNTDVPGVQPYLTGAHKTSQIPVLAEQATQHIHITLRCDTIMPISCTACFVILTSLTNLCLLSHGMIGGL
jgi:hypothetical protein